jgi:hypothetical protein
VGRAIADEFHPESEHQHFLDNMRVELGNSNRLVEANGQLYNTRQVSGKANHRLRDSTTGGLKMLQAARSSTSRLPLHLERMLTYGQGPNRVRSSSAPGLSSMISPQAHVEDDQRQFHAFSSSVGFGMEEGGQYPDDRVAEMYAVFSSVPFAIAMLCSLSSTTSRQARKSRFLSMHDGFLFLARDQNVQVASTLIEQTMILFQASGPDPPSSQEVIDTIDQMVAHRNSSHQRHANYPN